MDQAISREPVEETTELALQEKAKLVKSLTPPGHGRLHRVRVRGAGHAGHGRLQRRPGVHLADRAGASLFVLPYALLMAEVGSAFTQEGGPYEWSKMAFGRLQGAIAAVLYWVTNPLWVGGSLAFIATEAWNDNIFKIRAGGAGDYLFKFLFIWISIGVAIVSLKRGKWIPNVGALMRIVVLGFFTLTTIIYAFSHGVDGFPIGDLKPTGAIFLALVPLLLFNYVGFELQNGAAEEMEDPQKDVPLSVLRSGVIGVLLYAIPIFAILIVLPQEKVTGIGGFLDAVTETFSVYGGASSFLLGVMTVCFVITLLTSGAVWMIGSDRILAVAAYDGAFPGFFGVFNRTFGTPVRVNTMSGIFATIFMVVAVASFHGGTDAKFVVVLTIAISTTLISYLWVFPSALKLRYTHPHVRRPYQRARRAARDVDRRGPDHVLDRAGQLRRGLPGHAREPLRDRLQLRGRVGRQPRDLRGADPGHAGGRPGHRAHRLRHGPLGARARGGHPAGGRRRRAAPAADAPRARRRAASSSATTSPSSLTAARSSHGVGPWVTTATAPPLARVMPGSWAIGWTSSEVPTHSSTSAPGGQRVGALQGVLGQPLAEEDDVGLERLAAVAVGHAERVVGQALADLGQRVAARRRPGTRTTRWCRGPRRARACPPCGAACRCSG